MEKEGREKQKKGKRREERESEGLDSASLQKFLRAPMYQTEQTRSAASCYLLNI